MEYKGYTAKIELDEDANIFHGHVIDLLDMITFQGVSVDELRCEFEASVEDYLEMCAERGKTPEKPYSGKFVVRIEPELHRDIAVSAELAGQSLNTWVAGALRETVQQKHKAPKTQTSKQPAAPPSSIASEVLHITMTRTLPKAAMTAPAAAQSERLKVAHINRLNKSLTSHQMSDQPHQAALTTAMEYDALN